MFSFLAFLPHILIWYLFSLVFSLSFIPLGSFMFGQLKDKGYPFYRIIGIAVVSYLVFSLVSFKLLPFSENTILSIFAIAVILNFFLRKRQPELYPSFKIILSYELLFLSALLLWTFVKGHEPSIHSLEKYMDFGFIKSLLKSKFLPPQDMWFASTSKNFFSINYYYFGHFVTAFLIKLTSVPPAIAYNIMLSSIFAFGTTLSFSLGYNIYCILTKNDKIVSFKDHFLPFAAGGLSLLLTNFAGNFHTIYLFTKSYLPENPIPFWKILSTYNPQNYWYPNATRFIPFTIHEFPSYSYVVSDLHGHVLDIPFVLLILALFMALILSKNKLKDVVLSLFTAFVLAINYMTNSTDFLVYGSLLFFILVIKYEVFLPVIFSLLSILLGALLLTAPFSLHFKPFASSLGVNCAPEFLLKLQKFGPFLFEMDKCQTSPLWMLFIIWGFFWVSFVGFLSFIFFDNKNSESKPKIKYFMFFIFIDSLLLTLFAEFFYFKDIYPAHFRANTMFKLGYQAYIMMSILAGVTIVYIAKHKFSKLIIKIITFGIISLSLFFVLLYPFYSIPSYFGSKFTTLDGTVWIKEKYPALYGVIGYLNLHTPIFDKPALLEVHGDSYSDMNIVSAFTGLPTIVGWPVHEWLWRGSYTKVSPRVEEVRFLYESQISDLPKVRALLKKYKIAYIIVSDFEKQKYRYLNDRKFYKIGTVVYKDKGAILFKTKPKF